MKTSISYPVVIGEDNNHYLRYTYKNTENMAGAICLDFRMKRDILLQEFNTIIWGHDRQDGSMFGGLLRYKDPAYAKQFPYIYIYRDGKIYGYEIFAFYEHKPYGVIFNPLNMPEVIIPVIDDNNWYDNDIKITKEDRILTLYTCTEDVEGRYIMNAVLREVYNAK